MVPVWVNVKLLIMTWLMLGVIVRAKSGTLVVPWRADAGAMELPVTFTRSGLMVISREL